MWLHIELWREVIKMFNNWTGIVEIIEIAMNLLYIDCEYVVTVNTGKNFCLILIDTHCTIK